MTPESITIDGGGEKPATKLTRKELEEKLRGYMEAHADKQRLVREIDVILNGEEGAAKQASLCDLVDQLKELANKVATLKGALSILQQNILIAREHAECGMNGTQEPKQALYHVLAALPSVESILGIIPTCRSCQSAVFENWSKYAGAVLCRTCYERGKKRDAEEGAVA